MKMLLNVPRARLARPLVAVLGSLAVLALGGCPPVQSSDAATELAEPTEPRLFILEPTIPLPQVAAAFEASELDLDGIDINGESVGPVLGMNVMDQKLQDAIDELLNNPEAQEETQLRAVDQVIESLFLSNLVILPTGNAPEAQPPVQQFDNNLQQAIDALNEHIEAPTGTFNAPRTPATRDSAWEARNFLQVFQEAWREVGNLTGQCDPEDLRDALCQPLLADDEGGVDIDNVYPGFTRRLANPFFIGRVGDQIQEQVITSDALAPGECSFVLKEIQGVRALVRPLLIPVWREPWTSRATIIGFRQIWVLEFVPAEYLKTIEYCNSGGQIDQTVDIVIVNERELLPFWSYLNKDVTLSP